MSTMRRAALFDLDGTLFDSLGLWTDIDRRFFAARGIPFPADFFDCIAGLSFKQIAVYTKSRFNLPETPEALMEEWTQMCAAAYENDIQLKPGAERVLKQIKAAGTQMAVVTTLARAQFEPALRRLGVYGLFDAFLVTGEVALSKADGRIYLSTAAALGVQSCDCVVFEDVYEGIQGAKAAGMHVCLVYDVHNINRIEASRQLCDEYIDNWNSYSWS